jgi:mRNA interferase MazF
VVLVGFVFADESGSKLRPALIVSSPSYHRGRHEVIVAAITSNLSRRLPGDCALAEWKSAGLLFPSLVTGILRTVKGSMVQRKLGSLAESDLQVVDHELRRSLAL